MDQQRLRPARGLQAFGGFLFDGIVPKGNNPKVEEEVDLPKPIPVYMTYLTVQPTADGVQFLEDHYGRDAHLMERLRPAAAGRRRAAAEANRLARIRSVRPLRRRRRSLSLAA